MSYNELITTRSMNGIISIFSEDIQVNNLNANSIITEDIQINNSMLVDNITLSPDEIATLTGINTNETIEERFEDIETELLNVVHKTGNETISGVKNFTTTIQLTSGNLLTTNNSFSPANTTITSAQLSTLKNINTNETIEERFDDIETELLNVVHKTGNESISGTKNFTNTIQLTTGNLLTNNPLFSPANTTITSAQLSTLKNINTSMTIQQQINNVGIDGFMDLPSLQVAPGFKIFTNGLQTPSITNQETSGTVNGFFINNNQLLYTSYSGTFTLNVSLLTGQDSNGKVISVFDTVNNLITISTNTTPKVKIYEFESYKPNDATTEIFVYEDTINLSQNMGFIFNSINDFINIINTNSFFPLYTASIPSSYIQSFQGYINNQKLITPTAITFDNFFEGAGINRPCIVREDNPQETNIYFLDSPNVITDEPIKSSPSGFIQNSRFWLSSSYSLADNNFVEGSTTTVSAGSQIINSNVNNYQYTTAVSNSPSYETREGFVALNNLRIFDTNGILVTSGLYNITDDDGEYGFIGAINVDNSIVLSKGVLTSQGFQSFKAYINSNLDLVCLTNNVGKFSPESTIMRVDALIPNTNTYSISSPNALFSDTFTSTVGYKYDANTLITASSITNSFFFEIPDVVGNQYGSFTSTVNSNLLTVINSDYVTAPSTGTYKCVIVNISTSKYILFGAYDVGVINDFAVNPTLCPYTSCCIIDVPIIPPQVFNGFKIIALEASLTNSTAYINNIDYAIHQGYYLFNTTSTININDVICKNTLNALINGRYISERVGLGIKATRLNGNYVEGGQIPRASNKVWSKFKSDNLITPTNQYTNNTKPIAGNFLICNSPNFIVSMISSVTTVGSNYSIVLNPDVNTGGLATSNDLYLYIAYGTINNGFYTPVDFDIYETTSIRRYTEVKDFYVSRNYQFYNQETNNVYENRTYNEFQNSLTDVYSNNSYNIDTTVLYDLPNSGVNDTFVIENYAQNLSNKTFTDDTTFQQDIDVVDVTSTVGY
jgi:hypothetical protein